MGDSKKKVDKVKEDEIVFNIKDFKPTDDNDLGFKSELEEMPKAELLY